MINGACEMENAEGGSRVAAHGGCGSCCAGSDDEPATTALPAAKGSTRTGGAERRFDVRGLDCIEEVRILRRAVGPLVGGDEALAFDAINGRMSVHASAAQASDEAIIGAVAATGMSAASVGSDSASAAPDRGPLYATVASGVLLLAGIVLHMAGLDGPVSLSALDAEHAGAGTPIAERLVWLGAVLAGVRYVLPKAWYALRTLRPDMNLLMVVAVLGAIAIGEWFEAATVAFLFALSLLLERWSVGRARRAVEALLDLSPPTVRVVRADGTETDAAPADVVPGTRFVVRAGDRVALDGSVVDGAGSVDQASITGESVPVAVGPGDPVFAGTVNGEGTLTVVADRAADDTVLARIIRTIGDAHERRAPVERWVDRFARRYTPAVMILALAVLLVPPLVFGAPWEPWIYNALVLLVIACPCALVISTPVSVVASLAAAARAGVLIKGGQYVELPARLDALALDKTGTLTFGKPTLADVVPLDAPDETTLLAEAAALERRSSHPIAAAIVAAAAGRGVGQAPADDVVTTAGKGLSGRIGTRALRIGSWRFVSEDEQDLAGSREIAERVAALEADGRTVVAIAEGDRVRGLLGLTDTVRPGARHAIAELHALGVREIVMLTGDNAASAYAVAHEVGIDTVRAGLLPADKVAAVEGLAARHATVAMIGDGVNDAPAMARASFGIAMGAIGSDAAIETADVALMSDEIERLPWLVRHARRTLSVIRWNIAFSLGLKALFVLLTAFGVASLWGAIAADVGATLLVVANALRLLRGRADTAAESVPLSGAPEGRVAEAVSP